LYFSFNTISFNERKCLNPYKSNGKIIGLYSSIFTYLDGMGYCSRYADKAIGRMTKEVWFTARQGQEIFSNPNALTNCEAPPSLLFIEFQGLFPLGYRGHGMRLTT
jgi:hypothetical protein